MFLQVKKMFMCDITRNLQHLRWPNRILTLINYSSDLPEDERHPEAEEGSVLEGERHGDGQDVHLDPPLPVLRRQLRHPALVGEENQTSDRMAS